MRRASFIPGLCGLSGKAGAAGSDGLLNITTLNQIVGKLFHELSQWAGINVTIPSSIHRWLIKEWSFL
jgi:hypothetical protein